MPKSLPLYPKQLNVRVSREHFAALIKQSQKTGASLGAIIRKLIEANVKP